MPNSNGFLLLGNGCSIRGSKATDCTRISNSARGWGRFSRLQFRSPGFYGALCWYASPGIAFLSDGDRTARILYICGTILFLAWWFSGSRQPRYVMVGIAALLPLPAVLLASTSGRLRRGYEATIALGILFMLLVLVVNIGVEEGSLLKLG